MTTDRSGVEPNVEKHEEEIGKAFKDYLVNGLPYELRYFERLVVCFPYVDEEEETEALHSPSSRTGGSAARPLAKFGLTPLSIFYALDGIGYLIERLIEQNLIPNLEDAPVILGDSFVTVNNLEHPVLTHDLVVGEVKRMASCEDMIALEIYQWIVQVGQIKNYLFANYGFKCESVKINDGQMAIKISPLKIEKLSMRWS